MEYTILEIAQELQCTKNAVKYHVSKLPPEDTRRENGVIYVTQTGYDKILSKTGNNRQTTSKQPANNQQQPDNNRTTTSQQPDNNQQTTTQQPPNNYPTAMQQPDKTPDALLYDTLLKTVTIFENQLAVKDNQIAERDKQITSLTAALQAAQQTAAAAQALHAGTIQVQREAIEAAHADAVPETKKKPFWRWKKK